MTTRWVWDRALQRLIPSDEYYARKAQSVAVSSLPFPQIISDQIEVQSQVDGKIYTSKSGLRRHYRESNVIEVGNEWLNNEPKKPTPKIDRKAIRDSIGKAMNRVG